MAMQHGGLPGEGPIPYADKEASLYSDPTERLIFPWNSTLIKIY